MPTEPLYIRNQADALEKTATVAGVPREAVFRGWGRTQLDARVGKRQGAVVAFFPAGRGVFSVELMGFEQGSAAIMFLGALAVEAENIRAAILTPNFTTAGRFMLHRLAAIESLEQLRFAFTMLRDQRPHRWEVGRSPVTHWQQAILHFPGWDLVVGIGCRSEVEELHQSAGATT